MEDIIRLGIVLHVVIMQYIHLFFHLFYIFLNFARGCTHYLQLTLGAIMHSNEQKYGVNKDYVSHFSKRSRNRFKSYFPEEEKNKRTHSNVISEIWINGKITLSPFFMP